MPFPTTSVRAGGRTRFLAPLLGAVLLTTVSLAAAGPAAAAYRLDANEVRLADMINDYRQSKGLRRLWVSPGLSSAANWRSSDMCKRQYFSHTIPAFGRWPGGGNLLDYWKRFRGYYRTTYRFSELITRTRHSSVWVRDLFDNWRTSKLHNSMLLSWNGKYDRIGVGTFQCPNGRRYGTVILINMP